MPLYQDFADVYDDIFTENPATTSFLNNYLKPTKVLDLACGTGTYAIKLAEKGYKVIGTDLNETMIAKANEKKKESNNPVFKVENMLDLSAHHSYDSIYSIGNSIVHLEDEKTINSLFKKVFNALKSDGIFIIQIINYARILDQNIDQLPTLKNKGMTFERHYKHEAPYIAFNTALTVDDKTTHNTVNLYPIRPQRVLSLLEAIGFNILHTYGGFNKAAFDERTSIPFIVVAQKHV